VPQAVLVSDFLTVFKSRLKTSVHSGFQWTSNLVPVRLALWKFYQYHHRSTNYAPNCAPAAVYVKNTL